MKHTPHVAPCGVSFFGIWTKMGRVTTTSWCTKKNKDRCAMGLLPDTQNRRLRMRRECRERFPRHWLQRKPLVSDPGMHHGTCVTHVPWCMSGSLNCGGGGKRSRHSRRMRNSHLYVSGKRPMVGNVWPLYNPCGYCAAQNDHHECMAVMPNYDCFGAIPVMVMRLRSCQATIWQISILSLEIRQILGWISVKVDIHNELGIFML